eukprot:6194966-Pleurochrysis_carterae.AAC.1
MYKLQQGNCAYQQLVEFLIGCRRLLFLRACSRLLSAALKLCAGPSALFKIGAERQKCCSRVHGEELPAGEDAVGQSEQRLKELNCVEDTLQARHDCRQGARLVHQWPQLRGCIRLELRTPLRIHGGLLLAGHAQHP